MSGYAGMGDTLYLKAGVSLWLQPWLSTSCPTIQPCWNNPFPDSLAAGIGLRSTIDREHFNI
jgi:hypothetical protein